MPKKTDRVREARQLLERERKDVLDALAAARTEAQRTAERQKEWRVAAVALLERGDAAGLSVAEMARALGLSRQWTTHLRAEAERRAHVARVVQCQTPF